jgi:hypothetical protein
MAPARVRSLGAPGSHAIGSRSKAFSEDALNTPCFCLRSRARNERGTALVSVQDDRPSARDLPTGRASPDTEVSAVLYCRVGGGGKRADCCPKRGAPTETRVAHGRGVVRIGVLHNRSSGGAGVGGSRLVAGKLPGGCPTPSLDTTQKDLIRGRCACRML